MTDAELQQALADAEAESRDAWDRYCEAKTEYDRQRWLGVYCVSRQREANYSLALERRPWVRRFAA